MTPYRSSRQPKRREAPQEGIVSDMVRQFADPYAFLRELVQNSLDAGATRIDVALVLSRGEVVHTRVTDDGCGMRQDVVENSLCTLFSSTKEDEPRMVGKYGVGFVSVLAIDPDEVNVITWRDGSALHLLLHRDYTWKLARADPRGGSGTEVVLVNRMDRDGFRAHQALALEALVTWCRHVAVPIHLSVLDDGNPGEAMVRQINAPFTVFSAVSVTCDDGDESYVVGCSAGSDHLEGTAPLIESECARTFGGFYNRGLTLYESCTERFPGLDEVRFKVSSPSFTHVISRDNVRRDANFDRTLARVRRLVRCELRQTLVAELAAAAESAAQSTTKKPDATTGSTARYLALLTAARSALFQLEPPETTLVLTDSVNGRQVLTADDLAWMTPWTEPLLYANRSTALTRALAREGRPVLWNPAARVIPLLAPVLRAHRHLARTPHARAGSCFSLVSPVPAEDSVERELCASVREVLSAAHVSCAEVVLARVRGCATKRVTFVVAGAGPWIIPAGRRIPRLTAKTTLALATTAEPVALAREGAAQHPALMAQLLARMALLEMTGSPSATANEALLRAYARGGA